MNYDGNGLNLDFADLVAYGEDDKKYIRENRSNKYGNQNVELHYDALKRRLKDKHPSLLNIITDLQVIDRYLAHPYKVSMKFMKDLKKEFKKDIVKNIQKHINNNTFIDRTLPRLHDTSLLVDAIIRDIESESSNNHLYESREIKPVPEPKKKTKIERDKNNPFPEEMKEIKLSETQKKKIIKGVIKSIRIDTDVLFKNVENIINEIMRK